MCIRDSCWPLRIVEGIRMLLQFVSYLLLSVNNLRQMCIRDRCNGVMDALHPSTKNTLNRLLPTTLPMAISGFFFKEIGRASCRERV